MKKFNIIYYSFAGLFLVVYVYVDIQIKSESVYWLIAKLAFVAIAFFSRTLEKVIKKSATWKTIFGGILYSLAMTGMLNYLSIENYYRNVWQAKYGYSYNSTRIAKGIPAIPLGWRTRWRGDRSVDWEAKDSLIGHESKKVSFDSTRAIESEYDTYDLKPIHGKLRQVRVFTKYAKGKAKDSVSFEFSADDSRHGLTRHEADSIFDAEKIEKDY